MLNGKFNVLFICDLKEAQACVQTILGKSQQWFVLGYGAWLGGSEFSIFLCTLSYYLIKTSKPILQMS